MRLGRIISLAVVLVFLLFISASYVGYSNKVSAMKERGVWTLELSGTVRLLAGNLYVTFDSARAQFDATPSIPSFQDYLSDMFKTSPKEPVEVGANETFIEFRILVTFEGKGLNSQTLYDETIKVPYVWAGGSIGEGGLIYSFNLDLGPEIAYHELSPYKITSKAYIDNSLEATETEFLTIQDLSPETTG